MFLTIQHQLRLVEPAIRFPVTAGVPPSVSDRRHRVLQLGDDEITTTTGRLCFLILLDAEAGDNTKNEYNISDPIR